MLNRVTSSLKGALGPGFLDNRSDGIGVCEIGLAPFETPGLLLLRYLGRPATSVPSQPTLPKSMELRLS
jgi:hypothetical protein